jgi:succinate-semialdehyde dehydrogenase/glutarate-semialdehyde dehydrogenase
VFDRFRDGFAARKAIRVGNGLDEGAQMGPMANARRPRRWSA